jgi:hypothetical protein
LALSVQIVSRRRIQASAVPIASEAQRCEDQDLGTARPPDSFAPMADAVRRGLAQ